MIYVCDIIQALGVCESSDGDVRRLDLAVVRGRHQQGPRIVWDGLFCAKVMSKHQ
jgi:hypothetical protein